MGKQLASQSQCTYVSEQMDRILLSPHWWTEKSKKLAVSRDGTGFPDPGKSGIGLGDDVRGHLLPRVWQWDQAVTAETELRGWGEQTG